MVVANLQNGQESLSNIISYTTFNPRQPDNSLVSIDTILNHQGAVELQCHIDTAADLLGYSVVQSSNDLLNDSLITDLSRQVFTFNADNTNAVYTLVARGFCSEPLFTAEDVSPLVIEADADVESVQVNWNRSLSNSEAYSVFCSVDGAPETQVATDLTDTSIGLNFNDIADERAQNFCIRVEASYGRRLSASNTVCVERQADMWLPTAFTPNGDGLNDTFGPVVKSAQITDFEFIVYDRYGGRVYTSTSPDSRWDGTHSGKHVAEGGYLYYMKAKLQNGQTIERKGSVNVVYP
jgi:gliding motility-associated-like protein